MAFNIVKHRRGTTEEWKIYNLVPEVGELIIEECSDGFHRCKIGDGLLPFSELKYIDDYLATELLQKISDSNDEITNRILELKANSDKQILAAKQEFTQKLADELRNIIDSYSTADQGVLDSAKQEVSTKISTLQNELNTAIEKISSDLTDKIDNLAQSGAQDLNDSIKSIDETISKISLDIDFLTSSIEALDAKIDQSSEAQTYNLNQVSQSLREEIQEVKTSAENNLTEEAAKLTREFETVADEIVSQHAEDFGSLNASLVEESKKLSKEIIDSADRLEQIIEQTADNLTNDYESRINEVSSAYAFEDSKLNALISRNSSELEQIRNDFVSLTEEHHEDINNIDKSVRDLEANIQGQFNEAATNHEHTKTEINNKIKEIQELIDGLNSNDVLLQNSVFSINNRLSDVKTALNNDISELKSRYYFEQENVIKKIENLEQMQASSNANILNELHTYISNISTEILDLVDDDITIANQLFSFYNSLSDRIDKLKTSVDTDVNQILKSINDKLLENTEDISTVFVELSTVKNSIQEYKREVNQEFANIYSSIDIINSHLDTTDQDIKLLKEVQLDVNLRPDIEALKTRLSITESNLSSTKTVADAASGLAYLNAVKIATIDEERVNYFRFNDSKMMVEEDIIIFSCGNADSDI